jgi:hypothetical protein
MRPKDHPALKLHFISINADYMNSFDSTRLGLVMAIAVLKDFSDTSKALFRGLTADVSICAYQMGLLTHLIFLLRLFILAKSILDKWDATQTKTMGRCSLF